MTLLEVLIALAVFALVAAAGYTALSQGLRTEERLQDTRAFWQRLGSVLSLMRRDLGQVRNRPPRSPAGEWTLAFEGSESGAAMGGRTGEDTLFRFVRGGSTSFREGPASPYRRVAYRLREGELFRLTWPRLDAPTGLEPREVALMDGVEEVTIRYLAGQDRRWAQRWPRGGAGAGPGGSADAGLPRAVEITLEFEEHGRFERVFHVGHPR
ncbi:general secretion pathway protein J [Thiohalorhabdus denitrificans]|uniref:Type II secretion system protein J n=2 Tax=Thiohalorhabdus denitrificans TaxID=381306 RepID=A0A1G5DP26_9GAMM|nr:general secretion pathway protein J [Thiohalorhabdus denitrificans]